MYVWICILFTGIEILKIIFIFYFTTQQLNAKPTKYRHFAIIIDSLE